MTRDRASRDRLGAPRVTRSPMTVVRARPARVSGVTPPRHPPPCPLRAGEPGPTASGRRPPHRGRRRRRRRRRACARRRMPPGPGPPVSAARVPSRAAPAQGAGSSCWGRSGSRAARGVADARARPWAAVPGPAARRRAGRAPLLLHVTPPAAGGGGAPGAVGPAAAAAANEVVAAEEWSRSARPRSPALARPCRACRWSAKLKPCRI